MPRTSIAVLSFLTCANLCIAQTAPPWSQLSLSTCNVDAYRQVHPTGDGRGIVIAVLDTGVDMSIPGLQKTTTGQIKVIDVQDFSGEGDVAIRRAIWNAAKDRIVHYAKDGSPELFVPPPAALRPDGTTVWFGRLEEKAFKNSSVSDLNANGRRDDVFGICVISRDDGTDNDALCFVDTDADRDFSEEKPLKNYKLAYDTFTFARRKKEKQIEPVTLSLNVFIKKKKVVLHFDDGGHGTHVAGIAAGHDIQGQKGFDGVAPGAKVISLKIGNNKLAGGATVTGSKKRAFEYAARFAREHNVTVVCNLSYGIGSIREGHSAIDRFLDKLLRRNPGLIVCVSAGNDGPGLSSVGTPAAAKSVISAAALLAVDTARDVLGIKIDVPQLTQFSSRGGELAKPDVATPGMTTSTVPRWNQRGDFFQGTSMASPYATGLCALLAQHLRDQGIVPRADRIKQALKASADPVPGFTALDYGAGVPNIVKAIRVVEALAKQRANDPLYALDVSTDCPLAVDGKGRAVYWRSTYFPTDRPQVFTIKPVFAPTTDADRIADFSKRLILHSNADWCTTQQEQIYLRGEQSTRVRVEYDPAKLKTPGLHVAEITAVADGWPILHLVNSIVVPYRVGPENGYKLLLENQTVSGWKVHRYFVEVPTGASAMHLTLKAVEGKPGTAQMYYVFGPNGRKVGRRYPLRIDTHSGRLESRHTVSKELTPGVWELPITCTRADETSTYDMEVRFDGVQAPESIVADLKGKAGHLPNGKVTVTNVFDRPVRLKTSGRIEGYRKSLNKKLTPDDDVANISLPLTSDIRAVRVRIDVSDEDYAKFTDCAVNVYDSNGKAIVRDGLSEPTLTLTVKNPDPAAKSTTCKLQIQPAFTQPNVEDAASFKIKIDYLYVQPVGINVTRGDRPDVTLYPGIPTELSYELSSRPPEAPKGMTRIGYIRATRQATKQRIIDIEIREK